MYSPVYQPVNPILFWFVPVNIRWIKECAACPAPVTEHIGKVRGIDLSTPRIRHLLSESEGDGSSPSDSGRRRTRGQHRKHKAMCRYYKNFHFFFQHRNMVREITFSVPCLISLRRINASLMGFCDATEASTRETSEK
nr:MAG TPA: hypothetical protein [Caudoviricetes sp.]